MNEAKHKYSAIAGGTHERRERRGDQGVYQRCNGERRRSCELMIRDF